MPFPRLTTRRWMVVAAAAGTPLGLNQWMLERGRPFHDWSESYQSRMSLIVDGLISSETGDLIGTPAFLDGNMKPVIGSRASKEVWLYNMRSKYRRAAERPWLPVEPDPPEPE